MEISKQELWKSRLTDWENSGIDICSWCRQNAVSEKQFHYWINLLPSMDILQGEWIETFEGTMCSNCHKFPYDDGEYHIANWHSDYCPHCGARMKGAGDELGNC